MTNDNGHTDQITELRAALDALAREHAALQLTHKRLVRTLDLTQKQIQRNQITSEAKDNLARVVSARRSELERHMNLLLSNCPDIILLFDEQRRLVNCTASFLRRCRIPGFGMVRGHSFDEVVLPHVVPELRTQVGSLFVQTYEDRQTIETTCIADFGNTGTPRDYTAQLTPMLDENEVPEGAMIILSDITEIITAKAEAEQASAAKSDFLAMISHEIRTPMNAILGVSNMLRATPLDERQLQYLRNIEDSSGVLLNLINDVLDISRIEAGKLTLVQSYFSLGDLLAHLQSMFDLMFAQKDLRLICSFSPDLPDVVFGDDARIRQVLTNILNNALKYTRKGEVRFRASCGGDGQIQFEIEDTGIGIREDAMARLFTAFEQLDQARNKGVVGTGLGLAITKRLCDSMKGTIRAESTYGVGSRFVVCLPLRAGTQADLPRAEGDKSLAFHAPDAVVLLVDDIEINLEVAAFMLSQFGIQCRCALSGYEAIELAAASRYDMIFMDHMMPEMDGIEAAGRIRSLESPSAKAPIVALTANAVTDAVEYFYKSGFQDFLSKPMDEGTLARCLLRWLPREKIRFD